MRKILFLLFAFIQLNAFTQHDIYVGAQMDLGLVGKTDFEDNTLSKKNFSPHLGGQLFVKIRLLNVMSLEAGIGQQWNNSRFKDPSFEKENEGFSVEMNNKNYYWNYYAAITGLFRVGNTDTYLYGKLGYSFNTYGTQTITNSKSFEISNLNVDETLSSTATYASSNQSFMPEIGVQYKFSNRNLISLGLKTNIGRTNSLTGEYTITNNIDKSTVVDNFSSLGNFTALTLSYNILLHHIPKKEKAKRVPKRIEDIALEPTQEPTKQTPTEIADRKLVVTNKMKVHTSTVTIFIWDHQTVDGDRVSLNLNGKWILENYTLEKEKYSFEIELEEGVNTFVLHALNLGKYKPNTAALIVKEGIKSHQVILESDLNESGTLEINYKKKKE